jgi:predicted CopG family antitoxin
MKATTIKIEGELLLELEKAKPESLSLSAYVREVLSKDLRRRKLAQAAASYEEFLAANPEEKSWLREWHEADLASAPKRRRR